MVLSSISGIPDCLKFVVFFSFHFILFYCPCGGFGELFTHDKKRRPFFYWMEQTNKQQKKIVLFKILFGKLKVCFFSFILWLAFVLPSSTALSSYSTLNVFIVVVLTVLFKKNWNMYNRSGRFFFWIIHIIFSFERLFICSLFAMDERNKYRNINVHTYNTHCQQSRSSERHQHTHRQAHKRSAQQQQATAQ